VGGEVHPWSSQSTWIVCDCGTGWDYVSTLMIRLRGIERRRHGVFGRPLDRRGVICQMLKIRLKNRRGADHPIG
jgi:hypothetical protein